MGAGRKTQTHALKEHREPLQSGNGSTTARNITKNNLAGVIFGGTNNTIEECFAKELFGLPAPHFSYIRYIIPGMPLFLFNYSDRNLYGIFEASSYGQMYIDRSGWTTMDSVSSPYPAQVRFRTRNLCGPLNEDKFKPAIAKNYYEPRLFWFELDKTQIGLLISLFAGSPITNNPLMFHHAERRMKTETIQNAERDQESQNALSPIDRERVGLEIYRKNLLPGMAKPHSSGDGTVIPRNGLQPSLAGGIALGRKWSSLFKDAPKSHVTPM